MDPHTAGHRRGVVAAPHSSAVEAGRLVLAEGGNALEAMVAMAATIAAVYPHMNHLGGDGFWLLREPNGRLRALMSAGAAGALARPELYREYEAIPPRGPLAALTVPGAVAGWMLALEAARAFGGRVPLDLLLGPAIRHARDGYAATASQARFTAEKLDELKDVPGFTATFLPDGKPPAAGATLRQAALAGTLDHLAHAGLDDFYRGDVAREMAADLERIGSPVTRDDLARHRAVEAEPLTVTVASGTLANTPPPTQGLASLILLAIFDRLDVTASRIRPIAICSPTSSTLRPRASTVARPRCGLHPPAPATPSGWAPPTPAGSWFPTSSRSTGSSAPAWCSPAPAC
jgi:oxamate amidohydrolase